MNCCTSPATISIFWVARVVGDMEGGKGVADVPRSLGLGIVCAVALMPAGAVLAIAIP